jgi:hypothetical protein
MTIKVFRSGLCEFDKTLCDKVCQLLASGRWFSPDTLVYVTNKTGRNNITELLLKVTLNTITSNPSCIYSYDIPNELMNLLVLDVDIRTQVAKLNYA